MNRPIYGSRMLTTADKLAGQGSGRGRPAVSDLRRATSTAYYAVFHQIVRHSALDFLPTASEVEVADIARWYSHAGLLSAAGLAIDAGSTRPLAAVGKNDKTAVMALRSSSGRTAVTSQLILVADAVQTLQLARHSADYDANYDPIRAVTINHVQDARAALKSIRSLWRAGNSPKPSRLAAHATYRTFLRLALLKSGGPKGR